MELSKSLENAAKSTIESQEETISEPISVEGTPFFLSLDGKGIIIHGKVSYNGQNYYIGTLEPTESDS